MVSGGSDRARHTVGVTLSGSRVRLREDFGGVSASAAMDSKADGHVFHLNLTIQIIERKILKSICSNFYTFIVVQWQV
jgi:hypothetical protein